MKSESIVSRGESLHILANDLRKAALGKRSAELNSASAEEREAIVAEIEREIQREVRRRAEASGALPSSNRRHSH